jgi:hypothetical protein
MSGMTERIVVVVLVGLVIGEFIWFRNNQPPPFGPCVQLAGTNNEIPVYYRQGAHRSRHTRRRSVLPRAASRSSCPTARAASAGALTQTTA